MSSTTECPVLDAIRARRVTRRMSDQPIDAQLLESVVRAGRWAPNAGNRRLQPVRTVSDAATIGMLKAVSPGMVPTPQAIVVISVDTARAERFGFPPGHRGLYIDVGTTAATLLLAAYSVGLGSCPVTSFSRAAVARILHLPDRTSPEMLVCLGYPADQQPGTMSRASD